MHVPIENIMSAGDAKEKLLDVLPKLDQKNFYLITQNDKPVAALVSIPHLMELTHDPSSDVVIDKPDTSTEKPLNNLLPKVDEPELPAPPKPAPATSMFGTGAGLPPAPPSMTPPLPPLPSAPQAPKPNPFATAPMGGKPDDDNNKTPLVTDDQVKQALQDSGAPKPPLPPLPDLPKPPLPPLPTAPMPPKPASPPPPIPSPFSNVSSTTINPTPPPAPGATPTPPVPPMPAPEGVTKPAGWPTQNPQTMPPTTPPSPATADDDLDDLDKDDEIL